MGEVPNGVCFLLCPEWLPDDRNWQTTLMEALSGGCSMVQLRIRYLPAREFYVIAKAARGVCQRFKAPLIINDRLDIALAAGAGGVHLGPKDLPVEKARQLLPREAILGVTTPDDKTRAAALAAGADFITCGPVFPSQTEAGKEAVGLEELARVRAAFPEAKLCALGGLERGNLEQVLAKKPDLVAISAGIQCEEDPENAARELVQSFRAGRQCE